MSDNLEAMGGKKPPHHHPPMIAPTFMQRLCDLLHQQVTVNLTCPGALPVAGMLHAVGQDYIEIHRGAPTQLTVTIIPLWNICSVVVAGAMDVVCPPPQPYPYPVSPGTGFMPGCPMPGDCPPPGFQPGFPVSPITGGPGHGHGPGPGFPGFFDTKEAKKEDE